jgi:hypothetical protein
MIPWSIVRPFVAGLAAFAVMFQALLLSLHFSLMAAPDVAGLNIICSEHASADLPAQDAPPDQRSTCSLCVLCSKSGAGSLALVPQAAVLLIVAPLQMLSRPVHSERLVTKYSPHPPSRGPPTFA